MTAKELADLLMKNPDFEVEVYHTDVIWDGKLIPIERTYREFDVNVMYGCGKPVVVINCN